MKKLSLYILLVLMWCNVTNAIPLKDNGQGELILSEKIIKEFYSYIITGINDNPLNFFITADHKNVFIEIRKDTNYKGYSGSGPIVRNKKKCEQKYKQPCFLFSNQRIIVWNNGTNPIDPKKSKISRKISYDELVIKLNELGFFETKKKKVALNTSESNKVTSSLEKELDEKKDELEKIKKELEKSKKELEDLKKQKNTKKNNDQKSKVLENVKITEDKIKNKLKKMVLQDKEEVKKKEVTSKTKEQDVSKEINQSSKLEALNQNISTSNQVKLIYCKVSAIREFLRDYRSNKKGDKVKLDYYIFDVEEDLQDCSNYKAPWSNSSISKLNIISSDLSNPRDAENYWVNSIIEYYNSINVKVPIGQKVSLKTVDPTRPQLPITKELTLNKSDLIRYCIGGNSTSYQNRRSIQRVSVVVDTRDNKIITYKCPSPSGNTRGDRYEIIPVSKGIFSKNDIKNYTFETQTEIKNINARIEKEKKEEKIAKAEEQKKEAEYANSPEGKLLNSYKNYILIKGFYESRKQYAVVYVSSEQFSNSRSQIKAIEKEITKNNNLNKDEIWNKATQWYKKEWAQTMEIIKSSGTYTQEAAGTVKIFLMSLNSTYNEVVEGASTPEKDF